RMLRRSLSRVPHLAQHHASFTAEQTRRKSPPPMAQRTQVLLIDDLDGSSADETLNFKLDGAAYEIDLSADNAGLLRKALADYVAAGRRASSSRLSSRRRPFARSPQTASAADIA